MSEWIPVEEALPEGPAARFPDISWTSDESDMVFVTVEFGNGKRTISTGRTVRGTWYTYVQGKDVRVVAWMPYPEPYMEDRR